MRKFILGVAATAAIVAPLAVAGLTGAASATVDTTPDCTPKAAVIEVSHTDYQYKDWNLFKGRWDSRLAHKDSGLISMYDGKTWLRTGVKVKHVEVAAKDPVPCVVGEPQPKVLPIPGLNNDQIYENPSEQYVPHITGHVSRGWDNGTADITYVTDAGWEFADGKTTEVVTVNELDVSNIRIKLPANPLANCQSPSTFVAPGDTHEYSWSPPTNHYALNGKFGITVTAKPGYEFAYGNGALPSKVYVTTCAIPAATLSGNTLSITGDTSNFKVLVKQKSTGAAIALTNLSNLAPGHYDVMLTVKDESAGGPRFSADAATAAGWTKFTSPTGGIFKISKGFDVPAV